MTVLDKIEQIVSEISHEIGLIQYHGSGHHTEISYQQLWEQSKLLAHHLQKRGLQPGQFVGIFMQRSIEHVISMLAILMNGAAFFSLNPRYTPTQLDFTARLCQSPFIIIDSNSLLKLANIETRQLENCSLIHYDRKPMNPVHQSLLAKIKNRIKIESFPVDKESSELSDFVSPSIIGSDVAVTLFTSGSTGKPKGVMITHQDLYNRVVSECRDFRLDRSDILLNLLPFSFDVGLNQLYTALTSGIKLVICNSWLPKDICQLIQNYHITGISGVPAIWIELMDYNESEVRTSLNQLRYFTISGGDLSESQLRQLQSLAPETNIYKTYGQTEAFRGGILMPEDFDLKITSVGKPVQGTEVFILNSRGKKAAPNEPGQIIFRGDGTMLGYTGDPSGTSQKLKANPVQSKTSPYEQQAIFTGDTGKIDEQGYLYILGRQDKMIKIMGNRVYPREILDVILSHPRVKDAVVFGIKNQRNETIIYSEIQPVSRSQLTEAEIIRYLKHKLPSYMVPSKIIFVTSFPRTPSGKIKLSAIEEKYRE